VSNPAQSDSDGDAYGDACDCAPADATAWSAVGNATGLGFPVPADTAEMAWVEPAQAGGTVVYYDVLRSGTADDFSSPACPASAITATSAADPETPLPASVFHYLVRSKNSCGGVLGNRSDGTPRVGGACP